jgi:hypothetical protein
VISHGLPDLSELAAVAAYAPHLAHAFASLACDMALVLDRGDVITGVAHSPSSQLALFTVGWVGRALADTVTLDTRHKIASLLTEVASTGLARRREVNMPSGAGADIPLAYTALRLGPQGPVLAIGHDLRSVALMQQRFMRVQQELERGYGLALRASTLGGQAGAPATEPAGPLGAEGPTSENAEQLNEASRVAFAAWLQAERLASESGAPPGAPASPRTGRRPRGRRR